MERGKERERKKEREREMDERDERLRASTAFRSISGLASQQHTSPVVSYLFETSATTALRGPPAIRQLCLQNDPTQKIKQMQETQMLLG